MHGACRNVNRDDMQHEVQVKVKLKDYCLVKHRTLLGRLSYRYELATACSMSLVHVTTKECFIRSVHETLQF